MLYVIHRDSLLSHEIRIRSATSTDIPDIKYLFDNLDNKEENITQVYDVLMEKRPDLSCFVALVRDQVIGTFIVARDVNLPYYKSHFHIQEYVLLKEHEKSSHTRLILSVINPIFERATRNILKEVMRLSNKTCMYFEVHDRTVIPPSIFHQMIHVRSRRFPHFLKKKWDHERFDHPVIFIPFHQFNK